MSLTTAREHLSRNKYLRCTSVRVTHQNMPIYGFLWILQHPVAKGCSVIDITSMNFSPRAVLPSVPPVLYLVGIAIKFCVDGGLWEWSGYHLIWREGTCLSVQWSRGLRPMHQDSSENKTKVTDRYYHRHQGPNISWNEIRESFGEDLKVGVCPMDEVAVAVHRAVLADVHLVRLTKVNLGTLRISIQTTVYSNTDISPPEICWKLPHCCCPGKFMMTVNIAKGRVVT